MTWRQKGVTYAVVVPFAIVLAFPFYFALVTMFKTNLDLANVEHSPYIYNDLEGGLHWDFWNYATTEHVTVPLRGHELRDVAPQHADRRRRRRRASRCCSRCPRATRSRGWRRVGSERGGRDLPRLPDPADAAVPPPVAAHHAARPQGLLWSLILIYPSFTVPFATWLLMGFFKTIPQELEDAAMIDGASRLKALALIVLPISLPGILTAVIFAFSLCVNEFITPFTFISSSEQRTVSAGIPNDLIRGDVFFWQSLMAATLIPAIPLALLYNAFLDRFIKGFTGGAFR